MFATVTNNNVFIVSQNDAFPMKNDRNLASEGTTIDTPWALAAVRFDRSWLIDINGMQLHDDSGFMIQWLDVDNDSIW